MSNRGDVQLEYIETVASNVILRSTSSTVPASGFFGINGGFFDPANNQLLSIAVNNNVPTNGAAGQPGSGWFNAIARGTVRWEGALNTAGVPIVSNVNQIVVNNRSNYWAQGGISMLLGATDEVWRSQVLNERPEGIGGLAASRPRSGLVYRLGGTPDNRTTTAFLAIARNSVTLEQFRKAIQLGIPRVTNGIFVDGGGSTQINCREAQFAGDSRTIPQIISLRNN